MKRSLAFLGLGVRSIAANPGLVAAFVLAGVVESGAAAATLWLLRSFLQGIGNSAVDVPNLGAAGGAILGVFLARALAAAGRKTAEQRLLRRVVVGAMATTAEHLLRQSIRFFQRHSHGDLVETVRSDIQTQYHSVRTVCQLLAQLSTALALAAVAAWISPRLFLTVALIVPVLAVPMGLLGGSLLRSAREQRTAGFLILDRIWELIAGLRLVRIYQAERRELDRFRAMADDYFRTQQQRVALQSLGGVAMETVAGLGLVVVLLAGGGQVQAGTLDWPGLLTFLLAVVAMLEPARNVAHAYADVQQYTPGLERVEELMAEQPEIRDRPDARPLASAPRCIRFESVDFAYDSQPVLRGISFELREGQMVGLVGPSGSGKSTVMALAARLLDPQAGRITFDGVDLRDLRLADVHACFGAVFQEPFLFAATVGENILYGRPEASMDEVMAVAEAAGLHEEIEGLPSGYDTLLGPGGQDLSAGQRQRLNIARALLKDAPILLLDEPTSSLDSANEARVQAALERLTVGRTVLVSAHRLWTLRAAAHIVVLADGRVEATGTHEELLQASPTYARMVGLQQHAAPPAEE